MITGRYATMVQPRARSPRPAFERLFDTMLGDVSRSASELFETQAFPPLNAWEDERAIYVEAELPGFSQEQIDIQMTGDELTLSGSREEAPPENGTFLRRERRMGRFSRMFHVPAEIDSDNVSATLRDGVLRVTLPKSPAAQPRKITVTSA